MKYALIVAQSNNRAIGRNNELLWHLPNDLKFFKRTTLNKPIIMGRKTYESIGRPLPGRLNIVISRQSHLDLPQGVMHANNLDDAFEIAANEPVDEVMVIGGGNIYEQALARVDRIYLTQVDVDIEGDVFFPEFDTTQWRQLSCEQHEKDEQHAYAYSFNVYERSHANA